jgi:hypothetical protein
MNRWLDVTLPVATVVCAIYGLAWPCMALWNHLAPVFHIPTIGYWNAVRALVLIYLLHFPLAAFSVFLFARLTRR